MNTVNGTFTREQAAKYLHISLPLLDAFLHRGLNPIPSIRAGRRYIIPRTGLDDWIATEAKRQNEGRRFDA